MRTGAAKMPPGNVDGKTPTYLELRREIFMPHVITSLCQRKGDCAEVCPVECIVPGPKDDPEWGAQFYIDPDTCIDCGACAPVCPPEAIFPSDELPTEHEEATQRNADFFASGPGYWDFDLEEQRVS
jgi:ferredoxin